MFDFPNQPIILHPMARKLRIQYPGALYHVLSSGNQGNAVFADDADRQTWLDTLADACEKTGWRIHAFVLLDNHFHILVETPEPNLVTGMKWLLGTYTRRFNLRHHVSGHLFQGRYKALIVDGSVGGYYAALGAYIHLNPVRAGLVKPGEGRLRSFRWSSYPLYLAAPEERPTWLRTDRVLSSLNLLPDTSVARERYEAHMEGRASDLRSPPKRAGIEAEWQRIRHGWYLGGETFRKSLLAHIGAAMAGGRRESYGGGAYHAHQEASAEAIVVEGLRALGLLGTDLSQLPKGQPEKQALAWWLRRQTTVSRAWLAGRLHMGHSSRVTQAVRRVQSGDFDRFRSLCNQLAGAVEQGPAGSGFMEASEPFLD